MAEKIDTKDLQRLIAEEIRLFIEENRKIIVERARKKLQGRKSS